MAVREAVAHGLATSQRGVADNLGGVLPADRAEAISSANGVTIDELMLLSLPVAQTFARPPISGFFVGAVGREAETGHLLFGGNLEFPGGHIGNTVHGEGFVFARAFSRGTAIETLALGEAHPCAHCRQFLSEFAAPASLTLIDPLGHRLRMADLYPWPFDPAYLGERGIVAGEVRHSNLELGPNELAPEAAAKLADHGRRSHVPYGKGPAAIVLTLRDGARVGGAAIESVAFNPTMSPLQAAMIDLFAHGYAASDIAAAAIAVQPGSPVDYARHARDLLGVVAPGISLETIAWA